MMTMYVPGRGQRPDGVCECGGDATTEIQCGYGPDGAQYSELCKTCWEEHVEWSRANGQCYPDGTPYCS